MPEIRPARTSPEVSDSLVACVELERFSVRTGLVDDRARLLVERRAVISTSSIRAATATIVRLLGEIASSPERQDRQIAGIGISVPGYVDPEDGRVTIPKGADLPGLSRWTQVALKDLITDQLNARGVQLRIPQSAKQTRDAKGGSHLPPINIFSRSAANVAAEVCCGAARGSKNAVFLSLEDEIEAGLLVDGRVIQGASGRAGAIGWFGLSEVFRDEFVDRGCLNLEAGRLALIRRTIESWTQEKGSLVSRLSVENAAELSPETVLRAARAGDQLAMKVVSELCNWIGRGIADLISTLNPEVVVIGGELGKSLKPFYSELRREARRWAEPVSGRQCRIVAAAAGPNSVLLGVARLAR